MKDTDRRASIELGGFTGLTASIRSMRAFYDALEDAADSLPVINAALCEHFIERLEQHANGGANPEEATLFPLLAEHVDDGYDFDAAVAQAKLEHRRDADVAMELAEALETAQRKGGPRNPAALGFLMRHFFECRRRHLAWEELAVLRPAARILTREERAALDQRCAALRQTTQPRLRIVGGGRATTASTDRAREP